MNLIKGGAILFIASMAGNISNYLFQFFMGRYLSVEDYGTMNAALSMLVIVAIPSGTIMIVMAKYVSMFKAKDEEAHIASLYRNSLTKMAAVGAVCCFPFLIFNNSITGYLKMDSAWPVIITGIGLFGALVVTVNFGMLQGLQRFYYLGAGMGLAGFCKLFFGVVFVLLGFGLNGAIAAPVVSVFAIFVITIVPLHAYFKKRENVEKYTKDILLYGVPVFVSSIAFTMLTYIDLIIVKHIFSPEEAGLYAAVTILGKTVLYLPGAFVLALFPMVSESHALNNNTFKILDKALFYTVGISMIGVLGFFLFPELAIRVLFGNKFSNAAPLLKFYGLAMMFMAITSILISFNLARHKTGFIYTLVVGCILLIILLDIFHSSLFTVIFIIMAVNFCLAAINLWMVYQDKKVFYRVGEISMEGAGGK